MNRMVPSLLLCLSLAGGSPRGTPPRPLDLNRATATELLQLPGVGPGAARRIVAFRKAAGGFRRPEELLSVKGIGERTFERLRPHVRVGALPRED